MSIWLGNLSADGVAEEHTHDKQEQVYYVLEGVVRIIVDKEEYRAEAGDGIKTTTQGPLEDQMKED